MGRSAFVSPTVIAITTLAVFAASGCGEVPAPLEGGGARGGPARGSVTVFALDQRTGAPIAGAEVGIAGAHETTGADGRAELDHDGPVDVTVRADGYLTESWLGVDAAELTIVLESSQPPPPSKGVVRARLEGLGAFVPSMPSHTIRAVFGVSRGVGDDPTATRSEPRTCATDCTQELEVPPGSVTVFAQIDEVDESGRRVAPRGFARAEAVEVTPEGALDVVVSPLESGALRELKVSRPAVLDGVDAIVGVPGLSTHGQVIVLAGDSTDAPFLLPAPEGEDSYWAVAVGGTSTASSRSIARFGKGELPASFEPPALRALPAGVRRSSALSLSGTEGAAMVTVTAKGGWRMRRFDDRQSVALPDDASIEICATDAERPAGEWNLADLEHRWSRRACTEL